VRDAGLFGGTEPLDLGAVDRLARSVLVLLRGGERPVLVDVVPRLGELLELVDLAGLVVEVQREAEGGEQAILVEEREEEAHLGDGPS
jgi:hypothetical protein